MGKSVMYNFITALQFLTCIRIVKQSEWSITNCGRSVRFFPLVGAVIGIVLAGMGYFSVGHAPVHVVAVVLIVAEIWLTGGLHSDGFMDTADGIFSGRSPARMLEIMKDSRVGAYGVTAFGIWLLLKWSLLLDLQTVALPIALFVMPVTGRLAMVIGIIYFPYARAEGLGKFFAESPGRWTFPVAILSVILLIAPLGGQAVAVCTASCLTGCGAAWWFSSRLGGLTGDIYGAINEITEIAVLLFWLV